MSTKDMDQGDVSSVDKDTSQQEFLLEVDKALENDDRKIGDVWRSLLVDDDVARIAEEMGWVRPSPVYSYKNYIYVLRAESPRRQAPIMALQCGRQIGSFIRRHPELSAVTKDRLSLRQQECEGWSNELEPQEQEGNETGESKEFRSGIYVYTLPHYIHHPVSSPPDDNSTPRTLLKVGRSRVDVEGRIRQQSTTALPEPPMILRAYSNPKEDVKTLEERIHRMLDAADHNPNREKGAGKEWFLTNLKFLDAIAASLDLQIHVFNGNKTTELEA